MKVGILAPIAWRIPPKAYGPWEQVVASLAAGLVARGVDVTLFATSDAETPARLEAVVPNPLNENPDLDPKVWEWLHVGHALSHASGFDVLHNHLNCYPLAFSPLVDTPIVTTLHGSALLEPATREIYRRFRHLPYVSISDAERRGCPELNYVATVYNGVDLTRFPYSPTGGDHLVFLGRMSAKKGVHNAIEVARRSGRRLVIAAHIPPDERQFFEQVIEPLIDGRQVEFVGEVGPVDRAELLGGAAALLHLVTVPEPFGLVMVEAQACGTPVIGFGLGSVPEVVADGRTGFVVDSIEDAVEAVDRLDELDRRACRAWVEERFTVDRMVEGYLNVYRLVAD